MVEFARVYCDRASLIRAILARISHPNKLPMSARKSSHANFGQVLMD
jgi:hypothetical protein